MAATPVNCDREPGSAHGVTVSQWSAMRDTMWCWEKQERSGTHQHLGHSPPQTKDDLQNTIAADSSLTPKPRANFSCGQS